MEKKIIGILVCMLLIAIPVLSVTGTTNEDYVIFKETTKNYIGPTQKITNKNSNMPDWLLIVYGSSTLNWGNVKPGSILHGIFNLSTCGDTVYWKIDSYPEWGKWIFIPSSGKIEKGYYVSVNVFLKVPQVKNITFTGIIKAINIDDPTNICEIDVYLKTLKLRTRTINDFNLIQRMLQKYPNLFPILQKIIQRLGLQ